MNQSILDSHHSIARRRRKASLFKRACALLTWTCVALLAILIFHVSREGLSQLNWSFLTNFPSYKAERAGLHSALFGTLWLIITTAAISIPIGLAAAIYLEEFAKPNRLNTFIEINVTNLAGVPSIVYGLLGLALFVRGVGLGKSVLAGALTMSLLILPVIITASREAIRAVPPSIRHAAFAIGASKWQAVSAHVLPACTSSG